MRTSIGASISVTVLEALEAAGHAPEHACRAGFCGVCRCRLVEGEVEYINAPLGFHDEGEILPCCSVPVTDIIVEITDA